MVPAQDLVYREGVARLLLGACLLLFAIFLGIFFLASAALGPPGLLGLSIVASLAFALLGLALAMDGFSRMSRSHA